MLFERDEFVEVHRVPEKPREIAVDLQTRNADDGVARAERNEHAFGNVAVGFERLIAFAMGDVACGDSSVRNSDGRDLWGRWFGRRDRSVSRNKHFRKSIEL